MPGNAPEAHITLQYLKVRRTDSGQVYPYDCHRFDRLGPGIIRVEFQNLAIPV
jgi:hypothetical protein